MYGWEKSLKCKICPQKLYNFLDRPKIIDKRFYFGEDELLKYFTILKLFSLGKSKKPCHYRGIFSKER